MSAFEKVQDALMILINLISSNLRLLLASIACRSLALLPQNPALIKSPVSWNSSHFQLSKLTLSQELFMCTRRIKITLLSAGE